MADTRTSIDDTQLSRLVVERKLCTANELDLVKAEKKALGQKAAQTPLIDLLIQHGYVTHSQVKRLNMSMDEDSLYRPAQQIPGFQILSKIGQGAMAVVFKAKQLSLDRTVAVKVLPKRLSENPEFVDRFYREGRAAARLNHSNIVQAFDVGESGGYHYFVMEYIDGKTAYDLIADGKHVAEKDALRILLQCAKALQHAHAQNLIHRDVKPKNLMITLSGDVKLADMGLAREVGDYATATAEAGRAYGTPYYISPEQIRGEMDIDARADIYGLGATFYHLVTGKVPFDGTSPSAVMHKHLKEPLVPADHVNPALSSGVGEIIEVMMAKNREERYPSMAEVITDIEAVYNGEPPLQARQKYDHKLLQELATGKRVPEATSEPKESASSSPRVSVQWLLVAGIVATISIILNIVLIATH